ncbi:MAG: UvrD-helicase domain-containing protein [Chryseobacterium sp.]|nr:UvrD-helicase domain-containing protein [Chryseobacterium sp.]
MERSTEISPAEQASIECIKNVYTAIDENKNFRVEAGAGAGKTYTLIEALKYLISKHASKFQKEHKKIACITYTNVAKDEIRSRVDNHPIIIADTIHAFAWDIMKGFQQGLPERIPQLGEKWIERIEQAGGILYQPIKYDLGYPKITSEDIYLHHNDVIKLFTMLLNEEKFKKILSAKFPIILIDEYQDTNKGLADALVRNFIETQTGSMIGFFGDHWQKIYGTESCGLIEADPEKLQVIGKQANFRSDRNIVFVLNKMRPELIQYEYNPSSEGEVIVYHTNNWEGERRSGAHWAGDLPSDVAHDFLIDVKEKLSSSGWDISPEKTKVLMLTNNVLATEQGYQTIASTFTDNDDYLKLNDSIMNYLVNTLEVGVEAYKRKQYGVMLYAFGIRTIKIRSHTDKELWQKSMDELQTVRTTGTVGDMIDLLKKTGKPRLSTKIEEREKRLADITAKPLDQREEEEVRFFEKMNRIRQIPYLEIPNLAKYIDNRTLYSTKHGVKGAEFENVIIVLGRGWNQYNWNLFLEHVHTGNITEGQIDSYERNRNLFYVACSRPRKRLCLLFTQQLSANALLGLRKLFGDEIISA